MPEAHCPATKAESCPTPAKLLKRYQRRARKELGQNFLARPSLALQIVKRAQLPAYGPVVELGVGLGTLTWALAQVYPRVIGFELDKGLLEILRQEDFLPRHVELRQEDILKLDYATLARELEGPLVLFGNLPYYLSSRLLFRLVQERKHIQTAVFMFQKEVAERLIASPGHKTYGPLSVLLALTARLKWILTLSPAQFYPPPEVSSAVLKISFTPETLPQEEMLFRVVKAAFAQRRKTLARNLTALGLKLKEAKALVEDLGYPARIRAEELPAEAFLALTQALKGA